MCGGIPVHIVSLTVGGGPPVKIATVPACEHGLGSTCWCADTGKGCNSNARKNTLKHLFIIKGATVSKLTIKPHKCEALITFSPLLRTHLVLYTSHRPGRIHCPQIL